MTQMLSEEEPHLSPTTQALHASLRIKSPFPMHQKLGERKKEDISHNTQYKDNEIDNL